MNRLLCVLLSLTLAFSLSACGGAGASAPEESSVPDPEPSLEAPEVSSQEPPKPEPPRDPIGDPAVIAYPELVDEELAGSPLYRQALERPSVIVYQDEVVTDAQPVYDFLAAVEGKEDRDLYIYVFRPWEDDDRDCYLDHFFSDQGFVTRSTAFERNWDSLTEYGKYASNPISLNEYGYLVYGPNGQESGIRVVSDRVLYDDAEQRRQLYDIYLAPIFYTSLGGVGWTSFQDAGPHLWLFEDIYNYENDGTPWDRFGSDWPVDYMVETVSRYFDGVTADDFISARKFRLVNYDPQTNTIHYEGGRGGGPKCMRVTGWNREGDRLSIGYENYSYETGVPFENGAYVLTVRLLEDGSFRYLSNQPNDP